MDRFAEVPRVFKFFASFACFLATIWSLQGCQKGTSQRGSAESTVQEYRQKVIGRWVEVDTKNEFLEFRDEGMVQMQSPSTNETCTYDFPDATHISFNCAPQGMPPLPQVWGFALKGDELLIKGPGETGKYKRE
jgi:hypothetical protein